MKDNSTLFSLSLKQWFVLHCIVDLLFAIPLFLIPEAFLQWLGWSQIDPYTTRLVAAALCGIGIESYLGRDAPESHFKGMLRLKLIWSFLATAGILWTNLALTKVPVIAWIIGFIFLVFHLIWWYWYRDRQSAYFAQ